MRILTRYMAWRFLGLFAAFLIVATATIVIVEMMLNLGDMLEGPNGLAGIASYLLLRVPSYYLADLVPIVAFAAAFVTLGSAARWHELTAMRAGGISPHRIAIPIILASALVTGAMFALNETVVRNTTRLWNLRESDDTGTAEVPIAFRRGSFWYHRGRTIYNISEADPMSRTLRGVRIFELDEKGRLLRRIEAATAVVESNNQLRFESPVIRRFDPIDILQPSQATRHQGFVSVDLADGADAALMSADLATLSLRELRQAMLRLDGDDGPRTARIEALFHARLAGPFAVLIFVLAAIPLGIRVEQAQGQGMLRPAVYGIALVAAFFSLRSIGTTLAAGGLIPPSPAPWMLLFAFAWLGAWGYRRMPS